ncbi:MAG: U-box domain-containing protein 56 [Hungatella hathewayi]|nr:U-box domain-containing protein 56 [Hungatella hathewayi]
MNEELYEKLEAEFAKRHIDEEVEDVLLDMAEMLAEKNVLGKEISCKKTIGRTPLEAVGFCEADEEYPDEASVYIKTLTVAGTVYEIEDYLL